MTEDPGRELAAVPDPASAQTELKEYLFLLPRLAKLIWRLTRDPRVPPRSKAILMVLGAYVVSPVDLIPDFIPGLGQLDDVVIAAFALDQILNRIPDHIVREHWDGDEDLLQLLREILDISTAFMPKWLKGRLGSTTSS
ncbi:MAG TPA: YkvA family protein [Actinomycetota bacterium]|jgi:uncharacterized membrane protein YkvA (DUF1232 family)|nr:YkvA family protein [Actinomycetota bacterium]